MKYSRWGHQPNFAFCLTCRVRSRDFLDASTSVDFYFRLPLIHHPHNMTRGDCRRPQRQPVSKTLKMTTRGSRRSRRAYRAGVQGTLAIHFHFIYITNPLPPSPQPQPVPLHGKRADALPLASHSLPYPSTTHQHIPNNPNTLPSLVWCSGIPFYHPETKNATPGCILHVRDGFPHPRHENTTPVSRFRVWGIPAPFPPPSTTQTQRTRPCGHVLHVWNVADTNPAPSTTETWGTRPYGHVLCVSGVPAPFTVEPKGWGKFTKKERIWKKQRKGL